MRGEVIQVTEEQKQIALIALRRWVLFIKCEITAETIKETRGGVMDMTKNLLREVDDGQSKH